MTKHRIPAGPLLFLSLALAFWLAPFFWSGWKGQVWRWLPSSLTFQHTAAGLFTQRSTRWWEQHLEGTVGKGEQAQQVELDEWKIFPMGAFGYRTRYDRVLIETGRSRHVVAIRQRLAEHVLHRLQTLELPAPEKLRLVRSYWTVGSPEMAAPAGKWTTPPVMDISEKDSDAVGEYAMKNGKLEVIPRQAPRPAAATPVVAKAAQSSPPKARTASVTRAQPPKTQPSAPTPNATAFQRPGAPPAALPPRSQIKRRQVVQQLVTPGKLPGMNPANAQPPAKVGGLDLSKLKLGKPGVPVQKMPEPPPAPATSAPVPPPVKPVIR